MIDMPKLPITVRLKQPNICETGAAMKDKLTIFLRDCHLRKLKPTLVKHDGKVVCLETGDCWVRVRHNF